MKLKLLQLSLPVQVSSPPVQVSSPPVQVSSPVPLILLTFFILILSSFSTRVHACSCAGNPPFCETVSYGGTIWADIIVIGEKIGNYDRGMEVRIEQVLHGEPEGDIIRILRGNGADCGVNTDIFTTGEKLLMALNEFNYYEPESTTYHLSICGTTFLRLENGILRGRITNSLEELPLGQLSEIEGCTNLGEALPEFDVEVYPNPTSGPLTISFTREPSYDINAILYDVAGRKVRPILLKAQNGRLQELPLPGLPSGLYFLEVNALQVRKLFKIIIQKE